MKKTSIKDVALKAGVSTTLVSYVLNNRHTERINKETAAKIRQVAEELNYHPSKLAQNLKFGRTNTLALLVTDVSDPFPSRITRIIEEEAGKRGYVVTIGSSDERPEKLKQLIETFRDHQVDGFIIVPVQGSEDSIQELIREQIPVVLIDRYFKETNAPILTTNHYGVSFKAVEQLLKRGRKNIGILTYKTELIHLNERLEGYKAALQENGLSVLPQNIKYITESQIREEVNRAIEELLSEQDKVDSLFFTTNELAVSGVKKLLEMGIRIPEELAILTFDESEIFDILNIPVTYIKQPLYEISKGATKTLIRIIEKEELTYRNRIYNSKIINGESLQVRN